MTDAMRKPDDKPTRSGFVALIGAPNAGKSTLLNHLVGAKVSIVSHKVQTTRSLVRGIVIHNGAQIVFVDTPGIFKPRRRRTVGAPTCHSVAPGRSAGSRS